TSLKPPHGENAVRVSIQCEALANESSTLKLAARHMTSHNRCALPNLNVYRLSRLYWRDQAITIIRCGIHDHAPPRIGPRQRKPRCWVGLVTVGGGGDGSVAGDVGGLLQAVSDQVGR